MRWRVAAMSVGVALTAAALVACNGGAEPGLTVSGAHEVFDLRT